MHTLHVARFQEAWFMVQSGARLNKTTSYALTYYITLSLTKKMYTVTKLELRMQGLLTLFYAFEYGLE